MSTTKDSCLKKLRELRFESAGAPALVKQIDELTAHVTAHDFTAHIEESISERLELIKITEIFPGATAKKTTRIALQDGTAIDGKIEECNPTCFVLWNCYGVFNVNARNVEWDIRRAFEQDPEVMAIAIVNVEKEKMREELANRDEQIAALGERLDRIAEDITQITAENLRLTERNTELEAQLREHE